MNNSLKHITKWNLANFHFFDFVKQKQLLLEFTFKFIQLSSKLVNQTCPTVEGVPLQPANPLDNYT